MYLLDTNACIKILNDDSPRLVARLRSHRPSEIALCSIVKAELIFGARKSARAAANLATLREFFAAFHTHPFDDASAEQYGVIRSELERVGLPIGPHDLMIAAIAISRDAILVTHDVAEFSRVVGLRWEDWETA